MPDASLTAGGWGFPGASRKAHFFPANETISLCGKWMYTGSREPDEGTSKDDCVACRRRKEKV